MTAAPHGVFPLGSADPETDQDEPGSLAPATRVAPVSITQAAADRQRKARVRNSLRAGERVVSTDLTNAEAWERQVAYQDALAQARRLSGGHLHYLLAAMARSNRPCGYVTPEYTDQTPPRLADWSAWLHGMNTPQIHAVREELHTWGLLRYVDSDPMKVALVYDWEEWDASVWSAQGARPGAGRPRKTTSDTPRIIPENNAQNNETTLEESQLFPGVTAHYSTAEQAIISGIMDDQPEPASQAASRALSGKGKNRKSPATQGAAPVAPASPVDQTREPQTQEPALPAGWPARAEGENVLQWYLRVLRVTKNAPAQVAQMAARELGVDPGRSTILRLTGMHNALRTVANSAARWDVIVRAIVKTASAPYNGEPMDYVHQMALGLARQEAEGRPANGGASGGPRQRSGQWSGSDRRNAGNSDYWRQKQAQGLQSGRQGVTQRAGSTSPGGAE